MALPNPEYWRERSAARMDKYLRDSDQTLRIIGQAHKQAQADIQAGIDRIYAKVGKAYQLGPEEVQRLLAQPCGRAEYEQLLQQISKIKNPALRRPLEARAASGAYAYRVSRLEALRDNVRAQTARLADVQLDATTTGLTNTVKGAYQLSMFDLQRGTGHGFAFNQLNGQAVAEILHNPWSGLSFSHRIWTNQDMLADVISRDLTAAFMSGKSNKQMAADLADRMGVSYRNAERLVRTETNYMANAAEMRSYTEAGIDKYEYMATLDLRTSEVCQDLDGQIFACKDARPSVNMPPMHPYCRSTTVAHFDDKAKDGLQRRARDPLTDEPMLVPRDMKYKNWQKLHADTYGSERLALAKKMAGNEGKDREQFKQYADTIGKTPFTGNFKVFQQMKYTNAETYALVKLDYTRRARLAADPLLALPNANAATAAEAKFTKYLFDGDYPDGLAKGVAFNSRLGYNVDNWKALRKDILKNASSYPATFRLEDAHGKRFEQKQVIYGMNGKPANVVVGWAEKDGQTWMTSAYIKEVD